MTISLFRCGAVSLALVLMPLFIVGGAQAQGKLPDQPFYLVQEGDSLWNIAVRFKVSLDELEKANGISDPSTLAVGNQLLIPGLQGIKGRVDTRTVSFGETLSSLSRTYGVPVETLIQLNRLTSPAELYAGSILIIPVENGSTIHLDRVELSPGQSLLELAVLHDTDPWTIVVDNNISGSWSALPEDILRIRQSAVADAQTAPGALPETITQAVIEPVTPMQGKTTEIKISGPDGLTITGSLIGHDLHFFRYKNEYVAFQGIPALAVPGLYPVVLSWSLPDGKLFTFTQDILVRDAGYPFDPPLQVDPKTVDPAVTGPESELWAKLGLPVTPEKQWDGQFSSPVPPEFTTCWPSLFGSRRAYNGGTYDTFHGGLDFCGGIGTKLYAAAAGTVVFTGPLTVRGNVTVIDHGWGIYTAYNHQSEFLVKAGDVVVAGQLIGLGGETGRTTGPHLHWEVWAGDVQVDPADWLQHSYP